MTPEQKFWQKIKPYIPGHVCRIENSAGSGMPDVMVCYRGVTVWIELKVAVNEKVLLRRYQWGWTKEHTEAGGKVVILAEFPTCIKAWHAHVWCTAVAYGNTDEYAEICEQGSRKLQARDLKNILFT